MHSYLAEKLYVAVETLAKSEKPPRERLADAWSHTLARVELAAADGLSDEERKQLQELSSYFQSANDPELGSAQASAAAWDNTELNNVSELLAGLILLGNQVEHKK